MLIPLGKRIIVKPIEIKHSTLHLVNVKPSQFQVITVGDEVTRVKPNDIIYLDKHLGAILEHEKETFLVVDESSILAKIS